MPSVATLKHRIGGCQGSGSGDGIGFEYSVNGTDVLVTAGAGRTRTGVRGKIYVKKNMILWSNGDVYTLDSSTSLVWVAEVGVLFLILLAG